MNLNQKKLLSIILITIVIFISVSTVLINFKNYNTIIIGTKNFTEQRILADMMAELIEEKTEYDVIIKSGLGETAFLQGAILNDDIDMYVEYSSNAYEGVLNQEYQGESSEVINNYIDQQYNQVYDLDWLLMFGFENTNAIICQQYCIDNNISTLEDLSNYDDFTFAAPANFYQRSDGFNILQKVYGIDTSEANKLKMDPTLAYSGVSNGDVDVGLGFTTDGRLVDDDYLILSDDLNGFPKYDAGIVVSNQFEEEYPEAIEALMPLEGVVSNQDMQQMNYQVEILHENEDDVAHQFLLDNQLV